MNIIKSSYVDEMIINKSRFITYLYKVRNEEECKMYIEKLWQNHKSATHICYAYIINNTKRFNDNGEPGGTAGMPILNVIENNELNYTLCCVVRYFGGVKLGAGGLVRAYSNCCSNAILKVGVNTLSRGFKVLLIFPYDRVKLVENVTKDIMVTNKDFGINIKYTFHVCENELEKLNSLGEVKILENIEIENDD